MLENFGDIPERGIIIGQVGHHHTMLIAHFLAMNIAHIPLNIVYDTHDYLPVGAELGAGEHDRSLDNAIRNLVTLQNNQVQDLISILKIEREDTTQIVDTLKESQSKYFGKQNQNYKNNYNTTSKQSYLSHTQKKI